MANIISKIKATDVDYAIRAGYMYYGKTSGTASALTVTITDTNNQIISIPELVRGMVLVLNLNVVPTESATLSVNGLTAKPIQYGVGEGGTKWSIDETYIFIYNGTAFVAISNYDDYNVTTTGSGNAITSITKNGKTITATKGSTFLTAHPTISQTTDTTSIQSVAHQDSFTVVDSVTRDDNGHVTKINTKTVSLQTPNSLTVGSKNYDGSTPVTITAADLGLDSALKYHGVTTTALTDGATTNPIVINGSNHTATTGCVVFYNTKEFVFDGKKWTELGDGSNHKIKQTAVASPSASGSTTAFIDTISQDENGKITATKKNVTVNITANATDDDVVILTGSGGANSVTYDAKHAEKGPSSGYTSGNTITSISGSGGTIKIPQITVDKYGHVTAADDESVTITIPTNLSQFTDDIVEGNYLPMAESTYDTTDTTNVLKHDGSWGIPELAEDLGGREETHHEEFFFQPTAGNDLSIKDGYAKIKSLKGNTIVWNQLCNVPLTSTITFENNIYTYVIQTTGRYGKLLLNSRNAAINHIYYIKINIVNNTVATDIFINSNPSHITTSSFHILPSQRGTFATTVKKTITDPSVNYWCMQFNSHTAGETISFTQPIIIDLTQMFGEGNEPTVEEFEAMYPNDYYEYNEGELKSFNGSAIKSVGFNQISGLRQGHINSIEIGSDINYITLGTGNVLSYPIKVFPNTSYYLFIKNTNWYVIEYDCDKKLCYTNNSIGTSRLYKTQENTHYILLQRNGTTIQEEINKINFNLSHTNYRNGEYEPYKESILQLPIKNIKDNDGNLLFPDGLRSAGTAYDEIVYDEGLGKYKAIKRIGDVDMGTLNCQYGNIYGSNVFNGFYSPLNAKALSPFVLPNCITIKYTNITPDNQANANINTNKTISIYVKSDLTPYIIIGDEDYTVVSDFQQSLQGQILYYELETPIEVILDDIDLSYEAWDFGTEELLSDVATTPVIAETQYNFNAVDMIRNNYFAIKTLKNVSIPTKLSDLTDDVVAGNYLPLSGGTIKNTTIPLALQSNNTYCAITFKTSNGIATFGLNTTQNYFFVTPIDSWDEEYIILHSKNYINYMNENKFPGINKTGTVTSITPGTGLTGTSSDTAITTSGTINLKTASADEIGGIKIGYTQSGKNYPIQLDSNNKAYVNVPWTDTDTNTHYTSYNIVGASASATANATAANGNLYLNHVENGSVTSKHKIVGSGATTVTSDANGNITITSPSVGETNQNAFSNVVVGSTTIAADSKTDTLTLAAGNNITLTPDATNDKITITATNTTYSAATTSTAGLMSASDKSKLDGIASGANNYSLPTASSSALGGIKIGYTQSGKNYPIQLDSNNKAYVNVPWTDTDTNTDTKVTSAANHYTPSTDANSALSVDASSTTAATWGTTQLVTGVNLTRDSKGHVTGLSVDSIKMPANPNTDTKVTAVGNHYTPSGGSAATATASGNTLSFGGAVITGVTKDAAGHVTGVTTSKLPANPNTDTQADWNVTTTTSAAYIKNKPTIPTVNDATIKITQNNVTLGSFTLNQSTDKTIDLPDHTFAFGTSTTIDFTSKRRTYNVITANAAVNIAYSSSKPQTGLEHYMLIKNNASTVIKVNFPTGTIIKSATVEIDPGGYVEISAIYISYLDKVVVTISDKLNEI